MSKTNKLEFFSSELNPFASFDTFCAHPECARSACIEGAQNTQDERSMYRSITANTMFKSIRLFFIFCICTLLFSARVMAVGEKIEEAVPRPHLPALPTVSISRQDITVKLGAYIMEEYFNCQNLQTFRSDFNDSLSFFRSRLSLILGATQGLKTKERPTCAFYTKLTSFNFWQREHTYAPIGEETLRSSSLDHAKLGTHNHKNIVPVVFLEDAFLRVNFDTFISALNRTPSYVQLGLYDYQIGRGIALGNYNDGALGFMGWDYAGTGQKGRSVTQSPAGVLVGCKPIKDMTCEFYFTRWNEFNGVIFDTNANTRFARISGKRPWRGVDKDRESYSFKIDYEIKTKKHGDVLVQPYFIYTRSPEQYVEIEADASSKVYTPGVMIDYKNKNWLANFELDGQFGHQTVHAIDRNDILLSKDTTTGDVYENYTYIYDGQNIVTANKARVSSALKAIVNSDTNRTASRNGQAVLDGSGASTSYYNAGGVDGFTTANRIRNGYKLNYRSLAALLDVGYEFDKAPFRVAGTLTYIGGDSLPYNNESNKTYKGFITMRDYTYWGYLVKSFASLFMRYTARPLNIDYAKMFAPDDIRDTSNLQYLGLSATWFPFKDRKKMDVMTNVLCYWEVGGMKKWDKTSTLSSYAEKPKSYIEKMQNTYEFPGWLSDKKASKMLGTELNLLATYYPLQSLRLYANGYVYFPGKLYKDLDGQPNAVTIRATSDSTRSPHDLKYDSMGHATSYGFNAGMTFEF